MGVIQILDEVVSNQIAAGEVVERPASVAKELIENALDAQATQIDLTVEGGGIALLRIRDNGVGMIPEDALLCLSRYATSKLKSPEDLHVLQSFGFRGEALPSIASVCRFTLITRHASQDVATKVCVEGGKITSISEVGAQVGSSIEVADLFYNVPARRKFLKSDRSESAYIEAVVRAASLSSPHVGFKLMLDGKSIVDVRTAPQDAGLDHPRMLERVVAALGEEVRGALYPFSAQTQLIKLSGYVAAPYVSRRDHKGIFVYVNHRPVDDQKLNQAIKVAFRTVLEIGRNPVCVLHLQVDPQVVDVNVHPQKREVRFSDPSRVQGHLIALLNDFLATTPWAVKHALQSNITQTLEEKTVAQFSPAVFLPSMAKITAPKLVEVEDKQLFDFSKSSSQGSFVKPFLTAQKNLDVPKMRYADFRVVGQVANTFLLLEGPRMMVILDQHAAHERVLYEALRQAIQHTALSSQSLLLPLQLRLNAHEMQALEAHSDLLTRYGFDLSPFGEEHAVLKATPAQLPQDEALQVVRDTLCDLEQYGRADALDTLHDGMCARIACHSAIRKGQALEKSEIEALLQSMDEVDFAAHCPHGRPVAKRLSVEEMAAWFNRHSI